MRTFHSEVPGHEGLCKASWLNRNQVCHRIDVGITGFFRLVRRNRFGFWKRMGPEFHGMIRYNTDIVVSTRI